MNYSSVYKYYKTSHGTTLGDLTKNFKVMTKMKCSTKFDCLLYEMLLIQKQKPSLNIQMDSLRKVLTLYLYLL